MIKNKKRQYENGYLKVVVIAKCKWYEDQVNDNGIDV